MGTQHYLNLWRSVGNDTFGVYTADNIRKANFDDDCEYNFCRIIRGALGEICEL
jgi:hypothetical protein